MSGIKLKNEDYFAKASEDLYKTLGGNVMAVPAVDYVSINVGMGKFSSSEKKDIIEILEKLTAQKPLGVSAKKSIANFKTRKGELIAAKVTLRGQRAKDFLMQSIFVALPRTRDFKGVSATGFDKNFKSFSFGIPSSSIYPAIGFAPKVSFGIQVTVIFNTADENNKVLLEKIKFPFKKFK